MRYIQVYGKKYFDSFFKQVRQFSFSCEKYMEKRVFKIRVLKNYMGS